MNKQNFAISTMLMLFLAGLTWTAGATGPTSGFFVDDSNKLTGPALFDLQNANSKITGTVTLANQSFAVDVTWSSTIETFGENNWEKYRGTGTTTGRTVKLIIYHNATLEGFVLEFVRSDQSVVNAYTTNAQDYMWLKDMVMASRTNWMPTAVFDVFDVPDLLQKLLRPTRPAIPPPPLGLVTTQTVLDSGLTTDSHTRFKEGHMEGHWGPRNNDYSYDAMGGQLQYSVSTPLRDDRYHGSFDEVQQEAGDHKWMTFSAWSPTTSRFANSAGTLRFHSYTAPMNWNFDPNPLVFTHVNAYPSDNYQSPVTIGASFAIGFGPVGLDLGIDFTDKDDGVNVELYQESVLMELDWRAFDEPDAPDDALGGRIGFTSKAGADGNYMVLHRVDAIYYKFYQANKRLYLLGFELQSDPSYLDGGILAARSFTKYDGRFADSRDFNLEDRTMTDKVSATGSVGKRINYFPRPTTAGEARSAIFNLYIFGPICEPHDLELVLVWYNEQSDSSEDLDYQIVPIRPAPGTCQGHLQLTYTMPLTPSTRTGPYSIYLSDLPSLDAWAVDYLDTANFYVGAV